MRWFDAERNNSKSIAFVAIAFAACLVLGTGASVPVHAQTVVGATICSDGPAISITSPGSDSVVTSSTVTLDGTVDQASQIEIRVDGVFDSTIPLDIGQTSFSAAVQLTTGTHTIEVRAVNTCAGPNNTASVVVTYAPAPQEASTGSDTSTTVEGVGVTAPDATTGDTSQQVDNQGNSSPLSLDTITEPLQDVARWLNIDTGGSTPQDKAVTKMSTGQAVAFTAGVVLTFSNVVPAVIIYTAVHVPAIASVLPAGITLPRRLRFWAIGGRFAGLGLILGALFL